LQLSYALRRELEALARGAGELARAAGGQGQAAERAGARLLARRRRAQEALSRAERFSIDLGLDELDPGDREPLGLGDA
jgi:hypothetical protein